MPRIIQRPADPMMQSFLDYVSRLQQERYQREQERAQEREAQEERTIVGVGAGLAAIGGALLAPAGAFGAVGGMSALPGTTVSALPGISATLSGAALGGTMAGRFAGGDIAGGLTTAAQAVRGIVQHQQDLEMFGGPVTLQERERYSKQAQKLGVGTLDRAAQLAREANMLVGPFLNDLELDRADNDTQLKAVQEVAPWITNSRLEELKAQVPGGVSRIIKEFQDSFERRKRDQAEKMAAAKWTATAEAEVAMAKKLNPGKYLETVPTSQIAERALRIKRLKADFDRGDLTLPEYVGAMQGLVADPLQPVITENPLPPEPSAEQLLNDGFFWGRPPMEGGGRGPMGLYERKPGTPRDPRPHLVHVMGAGVQGGPPPESGIDAWNGMKLGQQTNLMRDRIEQAWLYAPKGKQRFLSPDQARDAAIAFLDSIYGVKDEEVSPPEVGTVGPPSSLAPSTGPPEGIPGALPRQLPPLERLRQSYGALQQMVNQKPIETWTPQEDEQALRLITNVTQAIRQSEIEDPSMMAILQRIRIVREAINARRNAQS